MTPSLEAAEVAAVAMFFTALGGTLVEVGGWAVLTRPDRPGHPWMHQVVATGPVSVEDLDEALVLAGPSAQVQVPGGALPAHVLAARGFDPLARLARLVRLVTLVAASPTPAPVTPFALRRVGREAAEDVVSVGLAGFGVAEPDWWPAPLGLPGWTQVVAYVGAVPVASGALHVAGDIGWVGAASTIPAYRRRGAQTALLTERLRLAGAAGADQVVAKADPGSGSERNLLRAGFTAAYDVVQWRRR